MCMRLNFWTAMLSARVVIAVRCSVEKKKRKGHGMMKYAHSYKIMMKATATLLTKNVKKFGKHISCDDITGKKNSLSRTARKRAMTRIMSSATKVCTLSSVTKKFIAIEETWFWKFVTDALTSLSDCYVGQFLDNCSIDPPGISTEWYKAYKACARGF